jgi:hypothetical protein
MRDWDEGRQGSGVRGGGRGRKRNQQIKKKEGKNAEDK